MGSIARVKLHYTNLAEYLEGLQDAVPVYGTFLDGNNLYAEELSPTGIIIMGNEGNGISDSVERHVTKRLLIPSYPAERPTARKPERGNCHGHHLCRVSPKEIIERLLSQTFSSLKRSLISRISSSSNHCELGFGLCLHIVTHFTPYFLKHEDKHAEIISQSRNGNGIRNHVERTDQIA